MKRRAGALVAFILVPVLMLVPAGCGADTEKEGDVPAREVPGGDPERGLAAMARYGCGSCHTIPGAPGAEGEVGPHLTDFARRGFIAGKLPNTPENLVRWIMNPRRVEPGTVMPATGVGERDARDIAAYLYSLRRTSTTYRMVHVSSSAIRDNRALKMTVACAARSLAQRRYAT